MKDENEQFLNQVHTVLDSIQQVLIEKNKRYGNSALEPLKIFSKKDASQAILQRLDDKLSRIKNSEELRKNDIFDLMGYLVLLSISEKWDFFDLID